MNREIEIGPSIRAAVLCYAAVTAIVVAASCVYAEMLYAAVGSMSFLIAVIPFLFVKRYDLFCPWSFVLLTVFFGCTLQSLCISLGWPDQQYIDTAMLLGKDPNYFLFPSGVFLTGMICLTLGYFSFPKQDFKPPFIDREYCPKRMALILGVCLLLSVVATFAYIRFTGGAESGKISDKRATIRTLDVQRDSGFSQYGYLRHFGKLSTIAFLIMYSYFLSKHERLTTFQRGLLAMTFLLACAMPFYASSRAQVVWVALGALGVNYYHSRGNFWVSISIYAGLALAMFLVMSSLRNTETDDAIKQASYEDSVKSLVLNRNGIGLPKTSHIINHIPDPLEYQYGKTILVWLIAPVPREIYPNKPMVHTGPIIGSTIYGTKVSGVPPGAIAELYWNFHIAGVVFGMLSVGWLLQKIHSVFIHCCVNQVIATPVYLFAFLQVGFAILGHSVGGGTVMRFVDLATAAAVVFLCTIRVSSHE